MEKLEQRNTTNGTSVVEPAPERKKGFFIQVSPRPKAYRTDPPPADAATILRSPTPFGDAILDQPVQRLPLMYQEAQRILDASSDPAHSKTIRLGYFFFLEKYFRVLEGKKMWYRSLGEMGLDREDVARLIRVGNYWYPHLKNLPADAQKNMSGDARKLDTIRKLPPEELSQFLASLDCNQVSQREPLKKVREWLAANP